MSRRVGPPPGLSIDRGNIPAWSQVVGGPNGLKLAEAPAPDGHELAPGPDLRVERGAPVAVKTLSTAAAGELLLGISEGVAWSIRTVDLSVIHDRRPPGLDAGMATNLANAALLHADDGWRAVVMPSLGDIGADLGPGPIALRGDGRRVAIASDDGIEEVNLPSGDDPAHHDGAAAALVYSPSGDLLVAAGAALGSPGLAPAEGSPIRALAPSGRGSLVAADHADGQVTLWDVSGAEPRIAATQTWPAGERTLSLSLDGEYLALAYPNDDSEEPPVASVTRTSDGALVRRIAGARAIALGADGVTLACGGDWGIAWLTTIEEN